MKLQLHCGNPVEDKKAATLRFEFGVAPILENNKFERLNKKKHVMVDYERHIVVFCQSAPTNYAMAGHTNTDISKLKKKLGKQYTFYVHFNRPISEWKHKPVYKSFLQQYMKLSSITGIICGIDELIKSLSDVTEKQIIYKI